MLDSRLLQAAKRGDADIVRALLRQGAYVDGPFGPAGDGFYGLSRDIDVFTDTDSFEDIEFSPEPVFSAEPSGTADFVAELSLDSISEASNDAPGMEDAEVVSCAMQQPEAEHDDHYDVGEEFDEIDAPNHYDEFELTPLIAAVRRGHHEVVEILLDHGAQVNIVGLYGSALVHAVSNGRIEMVRLLIAYGADTHVRVGSGRALLHLAARLGQEQICRLLLDTGVEVDVMDEYGSTPLHDASAAGRLGLMRLLVRNGANVRAQDRAGDTALWNAIESKNAEAIEWLRSLGLVPTFKEALALGDVAAIRKWLATGIDIETPIFSKSPLQFAINRGHIEAVRTLLEQGAEVPDSGFWDGLLCAAAYSGSFEMVDLMLGARIWSTTALMYALCICLHWEDRRFVERVAALITDWETVRAYCREGEEGALSLTLYMLTHGHADPQDRPLLQIALRDALSCYPSVSNIRYVEVLLEFGADASEMLPHAIHNECSVEIIELLLRNGADVNATEGDGQTVTDLSLRYEHTKPLRMLITAGAPFRLEAAAAMGELSWIERLLAEEPSAEERNAALRRAAQHQYGDAVLRLLEAGADPNRPWNVLREAVSADAIEICRLLLDRGVPIEPDAGEWTLLHLAVSHGLVDMTRFLLDLERIPLDAVDRFGQTAWDLALERGNEELLALIESRRESDMSRFFE